MIIYYWAQPIVYPISIRIVCPREAREVSKLRGSVSALSTSFWVFELLLRHQFRWIATLSTSLPRPSVSMADLDVPQSKSRDLDKLLLRAGNLVGPDFYPGTEVNALFFSVLNRCFWFYMMVIRLLLSEVFCNSCIRLWVSWAKISLYSWETTYGIMWESWWLVPVDWVVSSSRTWLFRVSVIWMWLTWTASKSPISIASSSSGNFLLGFHQKLKFVDRINLWIC